MCFMFGASEEQVRRALGRTDEAEPEPAVQGGVRADEASPTGEYRITADDSPVIETWSPG
jgi:hypothetical protein